MKTMWIENAVSIANRIWIRVMRGCMGIRLEIASREARESETIETGSREKKIR